jgi:hypothetical protein
MRLSDLQKRVIAGKKFDPDALAYIMAVENADMQSLESGVKEAINDFVIGCKDDGIWNAIKASCILAGARTLDGALVPLKGSAPTNFDFLPADYDRKTGLVGDGSTKYLLSNIIASSLGNINIHLSCYVYENLNGVLIGGNNTFTNRISFNNLRIASTNFAPGNAGINISAIPPVLIGGSRSFSNGFDVRVNNTNLFHVTDNGSLADINLSVFAQNFNNTIQNFSSVRLKFYSIGEAIDLEKLDIRVNGLLNEYNAVI